MARSARVRGIVQWWSHGSRTSRDPGRGHLVSARSTGVRPPDGDGEMRFFGHKSVCISAPDHLVALPRTGLIGQGPRHRPGVVPWFSDLHSARERPISFGAPVPEPVHQAALWRSRDSNPGLVDFCVQPRARQALGNTCTEHLQPVLRTRVVPRPTARWRYPGYCPIGRGPRHRPEVVPWFSDLHSPRERSFSLGQG